MDATPKSEIKASPAPAIAKAADTATDATSNVKSYTLEEVDSHNSKSDKWVAIHGKVYDISKYVPEHPGGEEILLEIGDRTESFEDIGHSQTARDKLKEYYIGELKDYAQTIKKENGGAASNNRAMSLAVVLLAVLAYFIFDMMNKEKDGDVPVGPK